MAKIIIETDRGSIEYYQVPAKLVKAVNTLLNYAISGTKIVCAISDLVNEDD